MFYHNWIRAKGGLLTLLTNRVGDAILLASVCFWLLKSSLKDFREVSILAGRVMLLLAFTKSAQWPFIRWLPAAIAAPTPVSALVHSSTLVTAGV